MIQMNRLVTIPYDRILSNFRDHPILWLICIFDIVLLITPTVIIFVTSLGQTNAVVFPPSNLGLNSYLEILDQQEYIRGFLRSIQVATLSMLLSIPIGTLCSVGMVRYDIQFKKPIQIYLLLPFMIPLVVSGVVLLIIFGEMNLIGRLWPVGLALTIIHIPFMIWSVTSRVNALDKQVEYAAQNLGANEVQTFVYVIIPLLLPGIITGALIIFILGLNEFIVTLLITTRETVTLPVMIYTAIRSNITPFIAALSSVYVVIAILAVVLADKVVSLEEFLNA